MEAIAYPAQATTSGDLLTENVPESIAVVRGLLLFDVRIGQRLFYPDYGNNLQPFTPNDTSSALEAQILQDSLNRWCIPETEDYTYAVTDLSNQNSNFLDFNIMAIFP
jgi:hypothetical protein